MRRLISMILTISLFIVISSCNKKSSSQDLSGKGFIVTQVASCSNGSPTITNLNVGDLYIDFDSPNFMPAPNTWYRAANPGAPCGVCDALFRYKTGSDVSPKNAPVTYGADMNIVLTTSNLCR